MAYKDLVVRGPFKGIYDNLPDPYCPQESFRDVLNFFCRKGRVHTRPRLNEFTAPPDGLLVRNMFTFADANGGKHTVVLTTQHAYYLTEGGTYTELTYPTEMSDLSGTGLPYSLAYILDRVYFSNGSRYVIYCDGEIDLKVAGTGDSMVPGSARFLTVNAYHLLLGWTQEPPNGYDGSLTWRKRVRWSKSGDPDNYLDFSSGFSDLFEVPDEITGMCTLGRNTFIFRSNGISVATPTGIGLAPFAFEQYSYSPLGVGSIHPYSLAVYGNRAFFISNDDIYAFDSSQVAPIGGAAKKKIFTDLEQATGDVVCGFVIPRFGIGFDFLSYWISIPGVNSCWICNLEEGSWVRFETAWGRLTALNTVVTV